MLDKLIVPFDARRLLKTVDLFYILGGCCLDNQLGRLIPKNLSPSIKKVFLNEPLMSCVLGLAERTVLD